MLDYVFLSFAFGAGMVSFFSPCAVALLPAYVAHFMKKHTDKGMSHAGKVWKGVVFSFFGILGFFTIFGGFGLLLSFVGQSIKPFIPKIAITTGGVLILLGLFVLLSKGGLALKLPHIKIGTRKEKFEAYLFGIAYSIAALGCTFPIFIAVVLQGFSVGSNFLEGSIPLLAYILGIGSLLLLVTVLVVFSREWISSKINRIMPYIIKIEGLILIGAGIYMIWYQSVLV